MWLGAGDGGVLVLTGRGTMGAEAGLAAALVKGRVDGGVGDVVAKGPPVGSP